MTNYLFAMTAVVALGTAACSAADTPAPPPAKPAAAPAATSAAAPAVAGVPRYVQSPAGSTLTFSFMQAGAENQGVFKQFATALNYDEKNLAASSLTVTVQTGSADTQDQDRNDALAGADLLDPKKFPTAKFVATSLSRGAHGIEAAGSLTLHGVTKNLKLPLAIRTTATGAEISGVATIKRLDYGIGTGDLKSTEWVGDEVKLEYKVVLTRAAK